MDGVNAAPTEAEARSLLEKKKQAPVHSRVERVEPAKKRKTTVKKGKTPKPAVAKEPVKPVILDDADSSSPQGSDIVHIAVPIAELRPTGDEAEGRSSRPKVKFSTQDKGKNIAEGSGETPSQSYEKVYQRRICPHRDDVAFVELGHADLITRMNRASRNLVSERDMEYMNSLLKVEREEQARFFAADVSYFSTRVEFLINCFCYHLSP